MDKVQKLLQPNDGGNDVLGSGGGGGISSGSFLGLNTNMGNNNNNNNFRDYDYDRRTQDVARLHQSVLHFESAVKSGMLAMKEIAAAYESVGRSFEELTLRNAYRDPNDEYDVQNQQQQQQQQKKDESGGDGGANNNNNENNNENNNVNPRSDTQLTEATNEVIRRLARTFASESRRMNEGQPFQSYNAGIHRDVIKRLLPVKEHVKAAEVAQQQRAKALAKYNKYKAQVEKVEKRYAKKGKPFVDSKSHKHLSEKRDAAWRECETQRQKYNAIFALLMEVKDHASAQIIHRYLALNREYLGQLLESVDKVLPEVAAAYPLNNEYSSVQNSMIVDAVASAKAPFANHDPREAAAKLQQKEHKKKQHRRKGSGAETESSLAEEAEEEGEENAGFLEVPAEENGNHNANNNMSKAGGKKGNPAAAAATADSESSYSYSYSDDDDDTNHNNNTNNQKQQQQQQQRPPAATATTAAAAATAPPAAPANNNNNNNNNNNDSSSTKEAPARAAPAKIPGAPDVSFSPDPSTVRPSPMTAGVFQEKTASAVKDEKEKEAGAGEQ